MVSGELEGLATCFKHVGARVSDVNDGVAAHVGAQYGQGRVPCCFACFLVCVGDGLNELCVCYVPGCYEVEECLPRTDGCEATVGAFTANAVCDEREDTRVCPAASNSAAA